MKTKWFGRKIGERTLISGVLCADLVGLSVSSAQAV
jgi:hypothetical protein